MDRARWLLLGCLIAIAFAAMGVLTVRSEPGAGSPEAQPEPLSALGGQASPALAASSAMSGCLDVASPGGEDDRGFDVEAIATKVERLRELRFSGEPDVKVVSADQLDERVREAVDEQMSPGAIADEERVLKLLGAIPAGANLEDLYRDSLEGQVAGAYLPETREMLVALGEDPGALERIAVAHELEHALAHDRLGLPIGTRTDVARQDSQTAAHALVEGDASMLMELYAVRHVGLGDLLDLGGTGPLTETTEEFGRLPYHLQRSLLWPYSDGARFVCALHRRGGWKAVDRAYAAPPRATVEVLFPKRYGESPADSAPPGALPAPWRLKRTAQFGAAVLTWLFEAPGGDPDAALPDPRGAAGAWAGGESALWVDGDRSALGVSLVERDRAPRLCAAVAGWYAATRPADPRRAPRGEQRLVVDGPDRAGVVSCPPGAVRLGIGPTIREARALAG